MSINLFINTLQQPCEVTIFQMRKQDHSALHKALMPYKFWAMITAVSLPLNLQGRTVWLTETSE